MKKRMKKVLSLFLVLTLIAGMNVSSIAAEEEPATVEAASDFDDVSAENGDEAYDHVDTGMDSLEEDLSGKVFTELFGDGSEYQIVAAEFSDTETGLNVSYIAADDCDIVVSVFNEEDNNKICEISRPVTAGAGSEFVSLEDAVLPEYYWIEAELTSGNGSLSASFANVDRTQSYQEFLNAGVEDEAYKDNVVLDYGEDAEGNENFAVVSEDVKVVYVESVEETAVLSSSETDAVIGIMDTVDGYIFTDDAVINDEVVQSLEEGDKVLIYPVDDISEARLLTVSEVEETAVLSSDGETTEAVQVSAAQDETDLEEYFEFIRLNVTAEADTEDLDVSERDEDVEIIDEVVIDENADDGDLIAELQDNKDMSKTSTASVTAKISNSANTVVVKDTVSVTASVQITINYNTVWKVPTKLKSVTATSSLTVKNVFDINATKGVSYNPGAKKLGTIPFGTISGVTITVPVYLTFGASFNAKFHYNTTKTDTTTITARYSSGNFSVSTSKSSSSSKTIETEAKASVQMGIKCCVQASFLKIIKLSVNGEVGLKGVLTAQSINSTKTYKHNCTACLTADLYVYLIPSFGLYLGKITLAEKTWSMSSYRVATFYVSLANGKFSYGTGECPNKYYLVTVNVVDKNNKALKDVTVKEGSTTLGKTNNKGKLSVWLNAKRHVLKCSLKNYVTGTLTFNVTSATEQKIKLYKTGSNEAYFTMQELTNLSDEEWTDFIANADGVANTIFQIQSTDDLLLLSEFAAREDRNTEGLRFVLNSNEGVLDLSTISNWIPIGTSEKPFKGELNGNGFTITGFTIPSGGDYSGLFGAVDNALIHDLTISDAVVNGGNYSGILAGSASGSSIYDIAINGGSLIGADNTGGILGAMSQTELLNAYSTASVNGQNTVGGISGSFMCSDSSGVIENCYAIGTISGTDNVGAICGIASAEASLEEEDEDEAHEVGIRYVYYLEGMADDAVASDQTGLEIISYVVTEDQAKAENTETFIVEDYGYAKAITLTDALNNWYADYGAYVTEESGGSDEEGEISTIPEASANDRYNHWYNDSLEEGKFSNGGYPIFAQKEEVYTLTVLYVYEDGSEAHAPVVLYLTEGQAYDVDSYVFEGYHTNELEYKGNMPAYNLEYRVIYISDKPYPTMTELSNSGEDAASGSQYSIETEEELVLLSEYVKDGHNTVGVSFIQLSAIQLQDNSSFRAIGTESNPFKGMFNGNNLGIGVLKTSLFGNLDNAEIKDVMVDSQIDGSSSATVGCIALYATGSVLTGCSATASLEGTAETAGGLIGEATETVIENCTTSGTVTGSGVAGGLVGKINAGSITNSSSTAAVSSDGYAGGLVGVTENNTMIENAYSTSSVSGKTAAGGMIGQAAKTQIQNVYYAGELTGAIKDAVIGTGSENEAESVYYADSTQSSISGAYSFVLDKDGVVQLQEKLNSWVEEQNSTRYYRWSNAETESIAEILTPVFGEVYDNWLTDLQLENGKISYCFNPDYYPDGTGYLALYSETGQMISIEKISASVTKAAVPEKTAYAKAYILSEIFAPLGADVVTN